VRNSFLAQFRDINRRFLARIIVV